MSEELKIYTINRDASEQYKGYRYQKIRVAIKLLQLIKSNFRNNIIAIPEYRDDGYFIDEKGNQLLEQDKLYDKGFSFNSPEIQKTMVNFLDNYIELKRDPFINFIFCTNTNYIKEKQIEKLNSIGINVLEKPIIEYLIKRDFNSDVVNFVSKYLIYIYRETYDIEEEKPETHTKNYMIIKTMLIEDWIEFLERVFFKFGESDPEKLSEELDREIKECQFFTAEHFGKENLIKRALLDVIDERMTQKHVTQKIINVDSIKIIYKEAESENHNLSIDEVYRYWDEVESELVGIQLRNLQQKIHAVCPKFKEKTIIRYTRDAITVKDEIKKLDQRQIKALRYRVYESMGKFFDEEYKYEENFTFESLNKIIKRLKEYVVEDLNELKKDYYYGIQNKITVEKMTMLLIEECFYSFDEV